jgi:hypothetical protein
MFRRVFVTALLSVALLATAVPAASAKSVSGSKWGAEFCTALQDWQTTISDKGGALTAELSSVTNLTQGRQTIADFLGEMVAATKDATAAIKDAGTPRTKNGAKISVAFVKGFKAIAKEFKKTQKQAEKLPTTSAAEFRAKGQDLGRALSDSGAQLSKSFGSVGKLDKGKKLENALKAAPECAFLDSSSS